MKKRIWIRRVACEMVFRPLHPDTGALLHSERQDDAHVDALWDALETTARSPENFMDVGNVTLSCSESLSMETRPFATHG